MHCHAKLHHLLQPPLPEPLLRFRRRFCPPAFRRGLVDGFAGAGQGFVGELQVHQLHALDLVAQAAGFLELQVGGGLAHPAFQVAQGGLEVGADEGFGGFGHTRFGQAIHLARLIGAVHDLLDVALDRFGRDAVFGVIGDLAFATAVRLGDGALHASGHAVGVQDDAAVHIARGAADGLDQ